MNFDIFEVEIKKNIKHMCNNAHIFFTLMYQLIFYSQLVSSETTLIFKLIFLAIITKEHKSYFLYIPSYLIYDYT